jgi:hypothetical protein
VQAQQVAAGDMRRAKSIDQEARLRAFAGAGRTQQ